MCPSSSEGIRSRRRRAERARRLLRAVGLACLAGLPLGTVAHADEARDSPPLFDVGWDDGPTYTIGLPPDEVQRVDPTGLVKDLRLRGRIGGSLFGDAGWVGGDASEDSDNVVLRRLRLYTRGEFFFARRTEYKFEFAYEVGSVFLNDFYLRQRFSRWIDMIKIGYFDPPVSLEALTGSTDRALMELPPPLSTFAPGFRAGIDVAGQIAPPAFSWTFNLSTIGQRPNDGTTSSGTVLRATGRLVWRPWLDTAATAPSVLHLGASLRQEIAGDGTVRYRSRPESFLTDYVVDTGEIDGSIGTLGLEAAWRRGPLLVQGEALATRVDAEEFGDLVFWGLYAQASWVLTGEARAYDVPAAVFRRIEPSRPFAPRRGHWGALEVSGRFSWVDLSDGDVQGGRMWTVHVGPSWTWNRHVRIFAGYVFAHVSDRPEGETAHVLQSRIELWF